MNVRTAASTPPLAAERPSRAERQVLAMLARLTHGTLEIHLPSGRMSRFVGSIAPDAVRAVMTVQSPGVFSRLLRHGDIGLAEAYFEELWQTPDLAALLRLGLLNRQNLERAIYGNPVASLLYRITHWMRRNTRSGSRRNIHAHYDLGNRFYKLWLDPSMNYSSAWFDDDPKQSLEKAQHAKMNRALDEAKVSPGARVLEIGCGWGAVAEAAAKRGARLTGVTLSTEQLAYAQERLSTAGLNNFVDLRLQDYRDLHRTDDQTYDAVLSIEMFEAVGREYWKSYFQTVKRCLATQGIACIQTITIDESLFERYLRSTDFIQQYVFPGGVLPSCEVFRTEAQRAGLQVVNELKFGADYAHTLRHWRQAFMAQLTQVRAQGFDTRFIKLWEFYLSYCEAGFDGGSTDVVQFTLRHAD